MKPERTHCPRCGARLEFTAPALCFGLYLGRACGWTDAQEKRGRRICPDPPTEIDRKAAAAGDFERDEERE